MIRRNRLRFRLMSVLLSALLVLLAVLGGINVLNYGSRWIASPVNAKRLETQKQQIRPGDIRDRNGVLLATTGADGSRIYHEDAEIRRSASHLLGDPEQGINSGAETFQTQYLYGFQRTIAEQVGQILSGQPLRQGDDLTLTADVGLCAAIRASFLQQEGSRNRNGAAVVMNYRTGEILGLVSLEDFDPVQPASDAARMNRALDGMYAPGELFTLITAAAALENGKGTEVYLCTGIFQPDENEAHVIHESSMNAHGTVALQDALSLGCRCYAAHLAVNVLSDAALRRVAENFGFNDSCIFRELEMMAGVYPAGGRSRSLTAASGFGEGGITVSPLQMTMVIAAIANDGAMMEPRLLRNVTGANGTERDIGSSRVFRQSIRAEYASILRNALRVQDGSGQIQCRMTAVTENEAGQRNGWYLGFSADSAAPWAVCVVVEEIEDSEQGRRAASAIAADIFDWIGRNAVSVPQGIIDVPQQQDPDTFFPAETETPAMGEEWTDWFSQEGLPSPDTVDAPRTEDPLMPVG